MNICIAAPSFSKFSETFIRNHVLCLQPECNALICQDPQGADGLPVECLSRIGHMERATAVSTRLLNAAMVRWRNYTQQSMTKRDTTLVCSKLKSACTSVLLVEYLDFSLRFVDASTRAGVPLFVHAHGYDVARARRDPVLLCKYRSLFDVAAGVFSPSKYLRNDIIKLGCLPQKVFVSPCGVNAAQFMPGNPTRGLIVAVGRLVNKKGPLLTIKAFSKVRDTNPEAQLHIVGEGELQGECGDLVSELDLADAVFMHGAKSSEFVAGLLSRASVFVQHSITDCKGETEGLPVAILEAMACALPVVSTRHSGIPEAVADGETGFLVGEKDVDGMAIAINLLLSDRAKARRMGEAGRQRVLAGFTTKHTREAILGAVDGRRGDPR